MAIIKLNQLGEMNGVLNYDGSLFYTQFFIDVKLLSQVVLNKLISTTLSFVDKKNKL